MGKLAGNWCALVARLAFLYLIKMAWVGTEGDEYRRDGLLFSYLCGKTALFD